jgi:CelD/BcsL family acetyltransferase involved in cellulose biosynthesis
VRLQLSLVTSETDLGPIEAGWNSLLFQSERPSPFLTWEWISTWWRHFGHPSSLFVLVARDDSGNTVGIAPLQLARRQSFLGLSQRSVEFIGHRGSTVCTDHLDFLTTRENRREIARALLAGVFSRGDEWDALVLSDLSESALLCEPLTEICGESRGFLRVGRSETCPYLSLGHSWDGFHAGLRQKLRQNLRRQFRHLDQRHEIGFKIASSAQDVSESMSSLRLLHRAARTRKGESSGERPPEYWRFHEEVAQRMANAGFLHLSQLTCDGRPVASYYSFVVGNSMFLYGTGFDPSLYSHGVGTILLGKVVQDAIDRLRLRELDFLRGTETYKYLWGARDRHTSTQLYWKPTLTGALSASALALRRRLSSWRASVRIAGGQHPDRMTLREPHGREPIGDE